MNLKIKITIIAIVISFINYFAIVLGVYFFILLLISALITYFTLNYFLSCRRKASDKEIEDAIKLYSTMS